jgi:hypothetical protein
MPPRHRIDQPIQILTQIGVAIQHGRPTRPSRRILPASNSSTRSSSSKPRRTVDSEISVARATAATPPGPADLASAAAHRRRPPPTRSLVQQPPHQSVALANRSLINRARIAPRCCVNGPVAHAGILINPAASNEAIRIEAVAAAHSAQPRPPRSGLSWTMPQLTAFATCSKAQRVVSRSGATYRAREPWPTTSGGLSSASASLRFNITRAGELDGGIERPWGRLRTSAGEARNEPLLEIGGAMPFERSASARGSVRGNPLQHVRGAATLCPSTGSRRSATSMRWSSSDAQAV